MSVRAIVLAAGKGTRMKSEHPKVLHRLCGREMLWYALRALHEAGVSDVLVVANAALEPHVAALAADAGSGARVVLQEPQLGTGHAVQIALAAMTAGEDRVLVLGADMPLVDGELLRRLASERDGALAMVTARMPLPSNFGRVVRDGERVQRVVEERDADERERAIDEMNAGIYAFDEPTLRANVGALRAENAQREYYLTDLVGLLAGAGERILPIVAPDYRTVLGVNDRVELARARAHMNRLLCERAMRDGVTIVDPRSTSLEPDLTFGTDIVIYPNTAIGGRSSVGSHSEIGPNTRLAGAAVGVHAVVSDSVVVDSTIGDFAVVGPFAHVRGHSAIGTGVKLGNFVETKNARLSPGVKANHLSYLGDAVIGERTNVGAGTITCNYDGERKHETTIGRDAFIGSNSSLVAPISIGDGAMTGAGSVVIRDVAAGTRVVGNPARPLPKK